MLEKYGNLWSRVEFNDGLLWTRRWIVRYHAEENLLCLHLAVVCHSLWKQLNIVYYTSTNGGLGGCEIPKSSTIVCGLTCFYLSRCGFGWSAGLLIVLRLTEMWSGVSVTGCMQSREFLWRGNIKVRRPKGWMLRTDEQKRQTEGNFRH